MKNYIADGSTAVVSAPADVSAGDFVVVGKTFGAAVNDALSGAEVVLSTEGVFEFPKETGTAWTAGDQLYWDAGNARFTKTAGENLSYGRAHNDAAAGDAVGNVKLIESLPLVGPGAQQAAIADLGANHIALATANTYTDAAVNAAVNAAIDALVTKINDMLAKLRLAGVIEDA